MLRLRQRDSRESQYGLRLSENLGPLEMILLGRNLVSPILAQQLLQALLFVRCDGGGRALKRRKCQRTFEGLWFHRGLLRRRNGRLCFQLLHLLFHGRLRLGEDLWTRGCWRDEHRQRRWLDDGRGPRRRLQCSRLGLDDGRGYWRSRRYGWCGLHRGRRLHLQFVHLLAQRLTGFGNGFRVHRRRRSQHGFRGRLDGRRRCWHGRDWRCRHYGRRGLRRSCTRWLSLQFIHLLAQRLTGFGNSFRVHWRRRSQHGFRGRLDGGRRCGYWSGYGRRRRLRYARRRLGYGRGHPLGGRRGSRGGRWHCRGGRCLRRQWNDDHRLRRSLPWLRLQFIHLLAQRLTGFGDGL